MVNCSYCHTELDREVFCKPSHKVLFHRIGKGLSKEAIEKNRASLLKLNKEEVSLPKVNKELTETDVATFNEEKVLRTTFSFKPISKESQLKNAPKGLK